MPEKLHKAYADWQAAEAAYAEALRKTMKSSEPKSGGPAKLGLKPAMELLELRGRANSRMDRYFKKALT